MSVAGPIRSILQQQDRALYQVKKQIKEQGSKAVTQVREKLPTESEIKSKFKAQASAALCSVNGLAKSERAYKKIKSLIDNLKRIIDGAEKALNKIKSTCDKILAAIQKILGILTTLAGLIAVLSIVVKVAKGVLLAVGSIFFPPPTGGVLIAPGTAVFLKEKLDAAKGLIEVIKATVNSFPKLLERYTSKAKKYLGYIIAAIAALAAVKNLLNFIVGLLEALYLGMLSQCGSFSSNSDPTDEDGNVNTDNAGNSETPEEFLDNLGFNQNNISSGADPFDYSDDLADYYESQLATLQAQGNTEIIEKIYNANFQMLGYRRYKV
jgi:hypothetical protein